MTYIFQLLSNLISLSDTFNLYKVSSSYSETRINYTQKEIAWPSDHGIKFQNPDGEDLRKSFVGTYQHWTHFVNRASTFTNTL